MTLKAVLFDMDGTLVDSESVHFNCWNDILAEYGIRYEEEEFCQHFSVARSGPVDSDGWRNADQ